MQLAFSIFMYFFSGGLALQQLKVGIYNEIPDLDNDGLASYKNMIESEYNNQDHTVDAVVDPNQYSPYGDLNTYLSADGFDLIEMDTADLKTVVERDLIIALPTSLPVDLLQSAVSAVIINEQIYAYPTLTCGNFHVQLTPKPDCNLKLGQNSYTDFFKVMEACKASVIADSQYAWDRVVGGKMNDEYGWYLPFLYLDGYIDIHGSQSLDKAIDELRRGIVDQTLCERLNWLIGNCNDLNDNDPNKCYCEFPGSYVDSSSNVYPDVENHKTYMYFGFSEKVAQIERDSPRRSTVAISGPLGQQNILLQFTDALVINKARWNAASEEKRNAINDFTQYFMSNTLRTKIAMGEDLTPPRVRYLLQATETFYEKTNNVIYQDMFWFLRRAVAAPSLSSAQKVAMQNTLTTSCMITPCESGSKGSHKLKQEL